MPQPKKSPGGSRSRSTTARKTTASSSSSRKTTTRKPAAKKASAPKRSTAARKTTAAAASSSSSASSSRKPAARKTTARKTAASKPTARKTTARKPATSKTTARKTTARKPAARSRAAAAPKPAPAARRTATAAQRRDAAGVSAGLSTLREALTARANPLSLVMLTRDRVQEVFDEAVERGHMTRETANGLAQDLAKRSRREAGDIIADLEQLAGRSRSGLEAAGKKVRTSTAADRALQQVDRARRSVGVGPNFPILGYDDLNAGQISERLDGLTPAQLRKVRDYEKRHGNRKSVLSTVERKLS